MSCDHFKRLCCILLFLFSVRIGAVESPTSADAMAIGTPVVRIPKTDNPPTIDGVMEEGEWKDATALSAFHYDFMNSAFLYLAPYETQLKAYMMYDDENMYIAYSSPVYPVGSFLKSRGRFPRVHSHPTYGILRDDHIEFELRPYHDPLIGFQLGLFKWLINPIGVMDDTFWSIRDGWGHGFPVRTRAASSVTRTRWTVEFAFPFEHLRHDAYAGTHEDGQTPFVIMPPPDGTTYRMWLARGLSGTGAAFNSYAAGTWNRTPVDLIFDSRAVAFQINELGPIMEDIIDVHITVKNHNIRSEAVRLGFFMENWEGLIYSSYEDDELAGGILELIPGEVRELRLRHPFPGISSYGNALWFDVRTAGRPGKQVYLTKLIDFHAQDHVFRDGRTIQERRLNQIEGLRPPRLDFEVVADFWPYDNNLAFMIDRGLHGASDEAQTAIEARVAVVDNMTGDEIAYDLAPFHGDFATGRFRLPPLEDGREYNVQALLFDEDRRIVGEDISNSFNRWGMPDWMINLNLPFVHTPVEEWFESERGLNDVVWEPFTPIEKTAGGFRTLKHEFTLTYAGLPAQIHIGPDLRDLPLEYRAGDAALPEEALVRIGRGPQLSEPMRLEAVIGGERISAEVKEQAALVRRWESEFEYHSRLALGPVDVELAVRYDCDGSMHAALSYGAQERVVVESLELLAGIDGPVDMAVHGSSVSGGRRRECSLPRGEGVMFDTAADNPRDGLAHNTFVNHLYFGSRDRGFTWNADSDRGWLLDTDGSAMQIERNAGGDVTWRALFINHPSAVSEERKLNFSMLVHPAKPKPKDFRLNAWHYRGTGWRGYGRDPIDQTEEQLKATWRWSANAPEHMTYEEGLQWRREDPPWNRWGRWRQGGIERPHWISERMDRIFEDRTSHLLGRQISVGRRVGWWWDECWDGFLVSTNVAGGDAYFRDTKWVVENELPVPRQDAVTIRNFSDTQKRMARIMAENNVPQRQFHWANNQAVRLESYSWDSAMVERCGAGSDILVRFPMSNYGYMTAPFTGLVPRLAPEKFESPGGDKRHERQYIGVALNHDTGISPSWKGRHNHLEQMMRLHTILDEFGYFNEEIVEFVPYWRNQDYIRYGKGRWRTAPVTDDLTVSAREPDEEVWVSVYRSPVERDGRRGYKAMIVILNAFRRDVNSDLHILDPGRIFGGPNSYTLSDAFARYGEKYDGADTILSQWNGAGDTPVLIDLENGSFVELTGRDGDTETYGSVHVPRYGTRLLYGHFFE